MTQQARSMSPQLYARICGLLYLYIIAAGMFAELFIPNFFAELSLALWLTVKGVNVAKWQEKAGVTGP